MASPPVLFAAFAGQQPTSSLLRAAMFARALGTELRAMCVLPSAGGAVAPGAEESIDALEQALDALHRTTCWYEKVVDDDPAGRVQLASGSFVAAVATEAIANRACLIVVPPYEGRRGSCVTALATTAGVPVLVARAPMPSDTIVAATDLRDRSYPVVRRAAEIVTRFEAPLVVVHNVDRSQPRTTLEAHRVGLSRMSERVGVDAELVTTHASDSANAILAEARARDADMVVVGTHPHAWVDRILGGSVSAWVVDRAQRSVLVAPLRASSEEVARVDR